MLLTKKLTISLVLPIIVISATQGSTIPEGARAIKLSGGENHTLVLTAAETVWACGDNNFYQLGIGNSTPQDTLAQVLKGDMDSPTLYLACIDAVDAGWKHSLALDANGFVWAWGNNQEGQIGDNSTDPHSIPVQVHGQNNVGWLEDIVAISAGRSGEHSLALDANNFVWAWGKNNLGQLGNNQSGWGERELTPVAVHGVNNVNYLANIAAVSAGEENSMALERLDANDANCNGRVYCWGDNEYYAESSLGKLGNGDEGSEFSATPVLVKSGQQDPNNADTLLKNIVAIDTGWDHCMALEKLDPCDANCNGRVYTWGCNGRVFETWGGRLGNGTVGEAYSSSTPVMVLSGEQDPNNEHTPLVDINAISAGEGHCLALDADGYVWSWGSNNYGQLGNGKVDEGDYDPCTTPIKVLGPEGEGQLGNIIAISAGFWYSLAIDANGRVWSWGKGYSGSLGLGESEHKLIPQPIPIVINITQQTGYFRIQSAIDDANDADVIVASEGTFAENVDFLDRSITVRSADANDVNVTAATKINGVDGPVVTFSNNSNSILAGFTVTSGEYGVTCTNSTPQITNCIIEQNASGVYCNDASPIVSNCSVRNNTHHGFDCVNSSAPTIEDCNIQDNGSLPFGAGVNCDDSQPDVVGCLIEGNYFGIYADGSSAPSIANNRIAYSELDGIFFDHTSPLVIKNNWIHHNGRYGIGLEELDWAAPVRNNTIVDNTGYGIEVWGVTEPNLTNCIVWGNSDGQLNGCTASYSCIENGGTQNNNINSDPCFVDAEADDYHLDVNSLCEDAGDPNLVLDDPNETDIDGQPRLMGDCDEVVDMGADEIYFPPCWNCLTQCHADADCDGDVDTEDWPAFRDAFSTNYWDDWNDGAGPYNPCADYDRDGDVDTEDWPEFRDNFGTNPPADCNCGCGNPPDCWPPQDGRGGKGGGEQPSLEPADADALLEDMILWLMKHDLPGWEEFIESLKGKL